MILIDPKQKVVKQVDRARKTDVAYVELPSPVTLKNGDCIVGYYNVPQTELNTNYYDGADAVDHLMRLLTSPADLDVIIGASFDERFIAFMKLMEQDEGAALVVRTSDDNIAYCDFEPGHNHLDVLIIEEPELISGQNRLTQSQANERHARSESRRAKQLRDLFDTSAEDHAGVDLTIIHPL